MLFLTNLERRIAVLLFGGILWFCFSSLFYKNSRAVAPGPCPVARVDEISSLMLAPTYTNLCSFHSPRDFNSEKKKEKNPSSSHHQLLMKVAPKIHIQEKQGFVQHLQRRAPSPPLMFQTSPG